MGIPDVYVSPRRGTKGDVEKLPARCGEVDKGTTTKPSRSNILACFLKVNQRAEYLANQVKNCGILGNDKNVDDSPCRRNKIPFARRISSFSPLMYRKKNKTTSTHAIR